MSKIRHRDTALKKPTDAWRIKNEIIDELRKVPREYDSDDETLNQIEKDLADEAKELDFIGDILANGTDEEGEVIIC